MAAGKNTKKGTGFQREHKSVPPQFSWDRNDVSLESYPDDQYHCLKNRIGETFHRAPEEICVGNGSIEIIRVFCSVTLGRTKTFFLYQPTFGEYALSASLAGADLASDPWRADVTFICNPNNPTGVLQDKAGMKSHIAAAADAGSTLFCDEAFIDLADPAQSLAGIRDPHLFVLHSLTKSFSVPGIRFGFGFGEPELIEKIETARSPWSVNSFAESFAMQALCHLDELAASREAIATERDWLTARFTELGLTWYPSSANYFLVRCPGPAPQLCDRLLLRDILVRDCTSFGLPECIRVAVRTREENRFLIEALSACLR